jgi:hypothetical protein
MKTIKSNTSKKKRDYDKQYDIKNGRNEKVKCVCGGSYNVQDEYMKIRHINTKKHQKYLLHTVGERNQTNQSE